MPRRAANPDRRVLGRNSRGELRLRLLTLVLCSLWMVLPTVVALFTREVLAVLAFFVSAAIWLMALSRAIGTGGAVAFDSNGVEVKTLLKTWRYRWTDIVAVRWELGSARWRPAALRVVQRLQLRQSVDEQSGFVARMTGGAGMLPGLDPDEIEALREALAFYRSAPLEKDASTDDASVMRMLLGRCAGLGDVRWITKVGMLASIDLVDYETTGSKVHESVQSGDWALASRARQGTAGSDWVVWYIVECADGRGAVVEIVYYVELYLDEQASLIRTLTTYDLNRCRPNVTDWVRLGDDCAAGV